MSLLAKRYTTLLRPEVLLEHKKPLLLATSLLAAAAPLLAYLRSQYLEWLALGRGGVPHNILGFLAQSLLSPFARRDTRRPLPSSVPVLEAFAALYGPVGADSFLASWVHGRERAGARPAVPRFVAPQRQTSDAADAATLARMTAFLQTLAQRNAALFERRISGLEGPPHAALYLRAARGRALTAPVRAREGELNVRLGRGAKGEWAHVHGEGSAHVTLSPADAAVLIEAGWAERHRCMLSTPFPISSFETLSPFLRLILSVFSYREKGTEMRNNR